MSETTTAGGGQGGGGELHQMRLFVGCIIALVATAFAFAVRAAILEDWRGQFNLSNEQIGYINGAGLYPFAISIILFSLIVDRIGYGTSMVFAFAGHTISALITIFAQSFEALYLGAFLFALSNGVVEAVINPVTATMFSKNKTHYLSILHAGWPGGLVLGGLLAIAISFITPGTLPGRIWQWQMAVVLIPTVAYGLILAGQRFPVQERVAAGVSYVDMLREFGWGSSYIVFFLLIAGFNQIMVVVGAPSMALWLVAAIAVAPTVLFGGWIKAFGRPMFVFLMLVMFLLATTELGTDSWIADIMRSVLESPTKGTLFLVYTSFIMFVLRFFAGPIVERISPLGLLAASAGLASVGLLWLSSAGNLVFMLFLAATLYGFGKTFFWPATLGVVSEQYPRGGALMLNAIAGVGMLAVGTLGGPLIGTIQDRDFDSRLSNEQPSIYDRVMSSREGMLGTYMALDQSKLKEVEEGEQKSIDELVVQSKQGALAKIAVLPAIMFVCYLGLIFYFQSKGGYKAHILLEQPAADEY